jgi:hypothetical protein
MIVALILFVVSTFGGAVDGEFGYSVRKYWWVILVLGAPILFFVMGVDLLLLIVSLIMVTVVGGLFFWWMENDFELPKGDPIKKGLKWIRENIRW